MNTDLFQSPAAAEYNQPKSALTVIHTAEVLGQSFQIYGTAENPMFLAKDIASWIEHSDVSTMLRPVDDDEKLVQTMFVSGQNRDCWFLTESGLYEVLMLSRKPIAKMFKKRLNQFLMDQAWIYKQGDLYCPSCKIRDKGYCDYHVVPYINRNGEKMTREHLKWTEAGRRAIIELWNSRNASR